MKNKINFILTLTVFLTFSRVSFAMIEEPGNTDFAKRKADIISNINEEKSIIDQVSKCVNSAMKPEDLEKCHEIKKSGMKKIHEKMLQKRKQHLNDELKKIEEKEAAANNSSTKK